MNIDLSITDITPQNRRIKMLKAVRSLSRHLGVPVSVADRKNKHKHGPEPFLYKAQEELNYKWYNFFSAALKDTYLFVIKYFGLPEMNTVVKKANPDDPLTHKGKVLYSPETGEPIKKAEWDRFVETLEKFLNKRLKDADKKIILDSKALGRVLDRMLKYNTLEAVKELSLDDVEYRGKTLDWISDSVKNMKTALGDELSRPEMARIQVLQMSAAEKITKASATVKSDIRQILIDGVKCRKGKGQVSQAIFDRMTGANRDFQRIADTEIQNASNNSFLLDEVAGAEPGEKVYFQRIERIDSNTCEFCKKMHGVVVLWSDHPLPSSDKIDDPIAKYAIWDGKDWDGRKEMVANGVFHPYCYDSETEVMTHRGWKFFKDLLDDDRIMSINPENQEIDFVPFVNRVSYEYSGRMIHFLGRNYDLMVTPNHNMLYATNKGFYHGIEAQELIKKVDYSLPRGVGKWRLKDDATSVMLDTETISNGQYLRLWAWYLAEGSGRKKGKYCEVKLAQKDPQKIINDLSELKNILKPTEESVYIYGKAAEPFSVMFGIKAENKYIPQFIKDSSADCIREFLDAFSLADGSKFVNRKSHKSSYAETKNETVLRTSSLKMADDLCELIVKAGWMPSVYKLEQKGKLNHFANGDYTLNTDCYNITICKSKYRHFGKDVQTGHKPNHNPVETNYNGIVYDVELEKWHFLLVRRNGKCAWSGNCRGSWVKYNGKAVNALVAEIQGKSKEFNEALEKTKQEYEDKGVNNPNDKTPGFTESLTKRYGAKHGKQERRRYGQAFVQAKKEFEERGIEYPTSKTPGFDKRVQEIYEEFDGVDKSLTYSGHKLQDKYRFAGFDISVENKKGSTRSGIDGDGQRKVLSKKNHGKMVKSIKERVREALGGIL
ncbi:structural protein [Treponema sp. R6D11]